MAGKYNLAGAIENATRDYKVGRSVIFTVCEGHYIVNGEPYDFVDTLLGRHSPERATRVLRRTMDDDSIQIVHSTVYKQYIEQDLMDFWLEAKATSDPVRVEELYWQGRA